MTSIPAVRPTTQIAPPVRLERAFDDPEARRELTALEGARVTVEAEADGNTMHVRRSYRIPRMRISPLPWPM